MRVPAANVRTKSVYDPADPSDGRRVLVTRYWPRGIRRAAADEYVAALSPSRELLQAFKAGQVEWPAFRQRYLEQMRAPEARAEIQRLAAQASSQPITLMCVCRDPGRCHTSPLKELIAHEVPASL
jgi:uncharacterized protein YeaO (DUF488 family)